MKILLAAIFLFLLIHAIRIDFIEGTIPKKAESAPEDTCNQETSFITVTSISGDTIESLFALYPDAEVPFMARLENFYALNPHLKLQKIVGGDQIKLPLSNAPGNDCPSK